MVRVRGLDFVFHINLYNGIPLKKLAKVTYKISDISTSIPVSVASVRYNNNDSLAVLIELSYFEL